MTRLWILLVIGIMGCQGNTTQSSQEESQTGFYSQLKERVENEARTDAMGLGVIKYDKDEHDFGEMTQGEIGIYEFEFTNIGEGPLVVNDVKSRCGCTVPEWTSKPVLPGGKGKIQVAFDSKQLPEGKQSKAIIVYTNGRPYKTALVVRAFVNPKEN